MITNDEELEAVVAEVSHSLQEIQDYLGTSSKAEGRVRFSRGYIRTAAYYRKGLSFLRRAHKRNISYSLQSFDILKWLANRTDLAGPAKNLLNRVSIVILGSIAEALAVQGTDGTIGKHCRMARRLERMCNEFGIISAKQVDEIAELWERRNTIHIGAVLVPHIDLYTVRDVNKSYRVVRELSESLNDWHTEQMLE